MLIIIGGALYRCAGKMLANKFDLFYLALIRLIIIPVILILILKYLVLQYLPIPQDMVEVLAVVAVMPAASSSVIFAKEFGGSEDYAGASIVITTLLSLATIPLLLYLMQVQET